MKPLLSFRNITKKFGSHVVLDNLSLDIGEGEIFGLIGRSGSGKSTLLKILLGLYSPDAGKILHNDEDITGNQKKIRKLVGYTTQENSFYDKLTISENMRYYAGLYLSPKSSISPILNSVGLLSHKDKLAENISGGMKRRLDFAISLVHDPEILILDEPTTGLDPILVKSFWNVVKQKKGKTVIVITHLFDEIERYCDTVGILDNGQLKLVASVKDLKKKHMPLNRAFERAVQ